MIRTIALTGDDRVGKSTTARNLKDIIGDTVSIDSFSLPLKIFVSTILSISLHELEENKDIFRGVLLGWGEFFRENFSSDVFIHSLESRHDLSVHGSLIIDDLRYNDEAGWVRSKGGTIIKVINKLVKPTNKYDDINFDLCFEIFDNESYPMYIDRLVAMYHAIKIDNKVWD